MCVCVCVCVFILRLKWIYSIDLHFFKWKVRSLKWISLRLFPLLTSRKYEIGYEGRIANVAIRFFFFNGTRKKWGSKRSLMFAKSVLSTSLILPSPVTVTVVWDWIFPNWFSASQIYVPLSLAHKSKKKRLFTTQHHPLTTCESQWWDLWVENMILPPRSSPSRRGATHRKQQSFRSVHMLSFEFQTTSCGSRDQKCLTACGGVREGVT